MARRDTEPAVMTVRPIDGHSPDDQMEIAVSPVQPADPLPACLAHRAVFHAPVLEEPPTRSAPASQRRAYAALTHQAAAICAECPVRVQCLVTAVVRHDVAGFVAGTSARDRARIRAELHWRPAGEDLDAAAGSRTAHRPVSREDVVRLRRAYPDESLERLAQRLGCSLSTVKRHLRSHRRAAGQPVPVADREPATGEVLAAAARVVGASTVRTPVAA